VDRREHLPGLSGLVRLEVAEEMPPDGSIGRCTDLQQGLLDAVLPEVALPGGISLADGVERKRLGDSDEADGGEVPAGRGRRGGDARADGRQPVGDGRQGPWCASGLKPPRY
jgi:hypothetical protein